VKETETVVVEINEMGWLWRMRRGWWWWGVGEGEEQSGQAGDMQISIHCGVRIREEQIKNR
jgi:hypothetical protein